MIVSVALAEEVTLAGFAGSKRETRPKCTKFFDYVHLVSIYLATKSSAMSTIRSVETIGRDIEQKSFGAVALKI